MVIVLLALGFIFTITMRIKLDDNYLPFEKHCFDEEGRLSPTGYLAIQRGLRGE